MVTIQEARSLLEQYFVSHPPAISGELYIAPEWYEDASDFLPVWGAREFLVDGREAFARWDNRVIFIDKQTGDVHEGMRNLHVKKVNAMTQVAAPVN
ncbi:putative FMN-binding regulatory protein PaiB [Agromyces hippuratus]|uniref:Putative FMN-binding regulatory protein PaiB n=1 Tax=Agromyces hippuratus TaxID=286438 RepID=A0A852WTD7_9MICO|nr:hypothetical protein [Agromyces hippuratus]NYG20957.1 putative FMN-binding regulatory protein PaiB [Agromyces hippuratus]